MAKLYFRFGAMGSGKTIDLLKVAYNYKERGQDVVLYTAEIDNRYEVLEIIGVGGMAVVYKAYDTIDDRSVAIKILKEELLFQKLNY